MVLVADGLSLHVREWRGGAGLPVICLPGLARSLEDFCELAAFLSSESGGRRRVIAISARGRGESDRDPDPRRYDVAIEAKDALDVLSVLAIPQCVVVGTSRGGLQAMALAAMRPDVLRAVVLNDIGPVIESQGLARIRGYVGAKEPPRDWVAATARMTRLFAPHFTALGEADFALMALRTWREAENGLVPAYDPRLVETLLPLDLDKPLPPLWPLFDGLKAVPVMVIRGALSDILSAETVVAMRKSRPDLRVHEVPGQGHAPLLADRPTVGAIAAFLDSIPDAVQ